MTIDEAICHAKEVAQEKYNEGFLCHANPDDEKLDSCVECAKEHEQLAQWLEELKEYQLKKQQGLLVILPCKPGTIVYAVYKITVGKRSNKFLYDIDERAIKLEDIDCIGEYVFFTREAALNKITSLRAKKH